MQTQIKRKSHFEHCCLYWAEMVVSHSYIPAGIYLPKVNNRNTRTRYEICSELTKRYNRTTPSASDFEFLDWGTGSGTGSRSQFLILGLGLTLISEYQVLQCITFTILFSQKYSKMMFTFFRIASTETSMMQLRSHCHMKLLKS